MNALLLPEIDDIGLAAVFAELRQLASTVHGLQEDLQQLAAEVRQAAPALQADHEVLSQAIEATKIENDLFQVQTFSALRRNSEKLNALAGMLQQLGATLPEQIDGPERPMSPQPRPLPTIQRS